MDARTYLRSVKTLDVRIKNKLIERAQWRELALSITATIGGERVQSSGSQSRMADSVGRCIDMESEIAAELDNLIAEKKSVTGTIERLRSATQYDVLHMRYIQGMTLQDIADRYNRDYGWAKATHRRGLSNVQIMLDEQKEG